MSQPRSLHPVVEPVTKDVVFPLLGAAGGDLTEQFDTVTESSPYGWGQSMRFDGFEWDGILGDNWKRIVGTLESLGWWPTDLVDKQCADIGCFSGAVSAVMASQGAARVWAVDEVPGHLDQCRLVADVAGLPAIVPVQSSLYEAGEHIPENSLDVLACFGVLYHLSDMLGGLLYLRDLLAPDGVLLLESNVVNDAERSYANYGQFFAGMWWQPTTACVVDMLLHAGFKDIEVVQHGQLRCLVRATRSEDEIEFRRGINYPFDDLEDRSHRTMDLSIMRPAHPLREKPVAPVAAAPEARDDHEAKLAAAALVEQQRLQARLDAIERSTSWRLTSPLRKLGDSAPAIKRALRQLRP